MYVWIENRQQKRAEVLDVVTERWTSCPDFLCQPDADGFLDNDRTSLGWIWLIVPSETASLFPQNGKKKIKTQPKKKKRTEKKNMSARTFSSNWSRCESASDPRWLTPVLYGAHGNITSTKRSSRWITTQNYNSASWSRAAVWQSLARLLKTFPLGHGEAAISVCRLNVSFWASEHQFNVKS